MIAKLERTQSNAQQNKDKHRPPPPPPQKKKKKKKKKKLGSALNNKSTTTEPLPYNATGGLKRIYWYQIFALDYVVVKTQNCLARMEGS